MLRILLPMAIGFASTAFGAGGFPDDLIGTWHFKETRCVGDGSKVSQPIQVLKFIFRGDGRMEHSMQYSSDCTVSYFGQYQVKGDRLNYIGRGNACHSEDGTVISFRDKRNDKLQFAIKAERLHLIFHQQLQGRCKDGGLTEDIYIREVDLSS